MNINNIESELKFVNQLGITINTEERLKLEIVIQNLKQSQKFEHLHFWGKIEGNSIISKINYSGTQKDYYIVLAITFQNQYEFPLKEFFFW
jgi:radial spoke head protein 9